MRSFVANPRECPATMRDDLVREFAALLGTTLQHEEGKEGSAKVKATGLDSKTEDTTNLLEQDGLVSDFPTHSYFPRAPGCRDGPTALRPGPPNPWELPGKDLDLTLPVDAVGMGWPQCKDFKTVYELDAEISLCNLVIDDEMEVRSECRWG